MAWTHISMDCGYILKRGKTGFFFPLSGLYVICTRENLKVTIRFSGLGE